MRTRNSTRSFVHPSVHLSVRPLVIVIELKSGKTSVLRYFLCMFECWGWVRVWRGVGCPYPPVHNDIVTPRHLLIRLALCFLLSFVFCFVVFLINLSLVPDKPFPTLLDLSYHYDYRHCANHLFQENNFRIRDSSVRSIFNSVVVALNYAAAQRSALDCTNKAGYIYNAHK